MKKKHPVYIPNSDKYGGIFLNAKILLQKNKIKKIHEKQLLRIHTK